MSPVVPRGVRLAAGYALLVTAFEALVAVFVTLAFREPEVRSFDARLLGVAYDASQEIASSPATKSAAVARDAVARDPQTLYAEVVDAEGRLLGSSDPGLRGALPFAEGAPPPERAVFEDMALASGMGIAGADPAVRHVALPFRDAAGDLFVLHAVARTTGASQLSRDLAARLAWIVPLGFVAAFAAAWLLERRAMLPVRLVAAAAAGVGPDTLRKGIDVAGADGEIARLQTALNEALARLDEAFGAQSRFASNVSHELKTPIAVLLAEAQVLDPAAASPGEVERFRASVEAELRRLGRTVESFLVLARPGGESRLDRTEPAALLDVAMESVHGAQPLARQYDVRVALDFALDDDTRPPVVRGDPDLLRTMLDNLIANAIRFSPPGQAIDVRLAAHASAAELTVRDRGPGIPADYVDKVFDRFVQAPVASPRSGGAGIGLHIASTVARAHGGTVVARNLADGGCAFVVTLPLA